jgi:hypothetical protein
MLHIQVVEHGAYPGQTISHQVPQDIAVQHARSVLRLLHYELQKHSRPSLQQPPKHCKGVAALQLRIHRSHELSVGRAVGHAWHRAPTPPSSLSLWHIRTPTASPASRVVASNTLQRQPYAAAAASRAHTRSHGAQAAHPAMSRAPGTVSCRAAGPTRPRFKLSPNARLAPADTAPRLWAPTTESPLLTTNNLRASDRAAIAQHTQRSPLTSPTGGLAAQPQRRTPNVLKWPHAHWARHHG